MANYYPAQINGKVIGILSGDSLIVQFDSSSNQNPIQIVSLEHLVAPKFGSPDGQIQDEPHGFESWDFMRNLCIGQNVLITPQTKKNDLCRSHPAFGRLSVMFARVLLFDMSSNQYQDIGLYCVCQGWVRIRAPPNVNKYIQSLVSGEYIAKANGLGIWRPHGIVRQLPVAFDAKELISVSEFDAIVDSVVNGTTLSLFLLPYHQHIIFRVAACRSPSAKKESTNVYGSEAKDYTIHELLHRSMRVRLCSCNEADLFIGPILSSNDTAIRRLLTAGLAQFNVHTAELTPSAFEYERCEAEAKAKRLKIFEDYVPTSLNSNDFDNNIYNSNLYNNINSANNTSNISFEGYVRQIVGSCSIRVDVHGEMRLVQFSCIRTRDFVAGGGSEVYGFETREFIRKKLIGQYVIVHVDGIIEGRCYGTVFLSSFGDHNYSHSDQNNDNRNSRNDHYDSQSDYHHSDTNNQSDNNNNNYNNDGNKNDINNNQNENENNNNKNRNENNNDNDDYDDHSDDDNDNICVNELLCREGYANVVEPFIGRRSARFDQMVAAVKYASRNQLGIFSRDVSSFSIVPLVVDLSLTIYPEFSRKFFPALCHNTHRGVIEQLLGGNRFIVLVPHHFMLRLAVNGLLPISPSDVHGRHATNYSVEKYLNREIEFDIHEVDKSGGFLANMYLIENYQRLNIACDLLVHGFAEVHKRTVKEIPNFEQLVEAQEEARENHFGKWSESKADRVQIEFAKFYSVKVIEYISSTTMIVQFLHETMKEIVSVLPSATTPLTKVPNIGDFVCALIGEVRYRARVESILQPSSQTLSTTTNSDSNSANMNSINNNNLNTALNIKMMLIDYDTPAEAPLDDIFELPPRLLSIEPQAVTVRLAFISDEEVDGVGGEDNTDDMIKKKNNKSSSKSSSDTSSADKGISAKEYAVSLTKDKGLYMYVAYFTDYPEVLLLENPEIDSGSLNAMMLSNTKAVLTNTDLDIDLEFRSVIKRLEKYQKMKNQKT